MLIGRDLIWRLAGAMLVGGAACTGLLQNHRSGPIMGQVQGSAALVLGLISFTLALTGMLLIINGPRLRDKWRGDLDRNLTHRSRADRDRRVR